MATYWENSCSFGLRYVSWYKYLIVSLVFSHLGFWSGNLFLIAPFPDLCLLVPFQLRQHKHFQLLILFLFIFFFFFFFFFFFIGFFIPVNNFSVMSVWSHRFITFRRLTSTLKVLMCLAQGHKTALSISSPMLYQYATTLPHSR